MTGLSSLAERVATMERNEAVGGVIFAIRQSGELAEAAMRRRFSTKGPSQSARVVLVVAGIDRADDDGVDP
ncbi:hypothetical protein E2C06_09615 [Dankookia rubra]|uniref:Uncharacterized protein n=1 Tax=Dankookia rubra TaxID=1442381 RepID=A0A4R5QJE8_9PROT|nr:hypothetical protein [Dankookia rubra]TDH62929.1 hypothetical protein E2C06_09615 [Dankookia rubra]